MENNNTFQSSQKRIAARKRLWRSYCTAAALLTLLAFSPLVIPAGRHTPMLAGLPYPLWMGILVSVLLVLITFLATRVHPGTWEETAAKEVKTRS